jgi:hypothetical protein
MVQYNFGIHILTGDPSNFQFNRHVVHTFVLPTLKFICKNKTQSLTLEYAFKSTGLGFCFTFKNKHLKTF